MTTTAYLDNNATTLMPETIQREMMRWTNQGNPSAAYPSAKKCQDMMAEFRGVIGRSAGCPSGQYSVIFTSGATEANCMIIRGVIERARRARGFASTPNAFHIVSSAIEHKSILLMIEDLARDIPEMSITFVKPDASGHIPVEDFMRALRPSTCLAICMHANNETGAINDVAAIGAAVKAYGPQIFFHSDIVQSFGKIPVNLRASFIDGAAISFHKLHGPPGVGAAIINRAMLEGIHPILYGTQGGGMRGGTENVPGIGAAFAAVKLVFAQQAQTIAHELMLKKHLIARLAESAPVTTYTAYANARHKMELQVVIVGDETHTNSARYLPATLMIAVAKHVGPAACNALIKEKLEAAGVIVSVGSACNTASKDHSHVLRAMGVPSVVMDGAIRVSMCSYTTIEEIDRFATVFIREANRQYQTARK